MGYCRCQSRETKGRNTKNGKAHHRVTRATDTTLTCYAIVSILDTRSSKFERVSWSPHFGVSYWCRPRGRHSSYLPLQSLLPNLKFFAQISKGAAPVPSTPSSDRFRRFFIKVLHQIPYAFCRPVTVPSCRLHKIPGYSIENRGSSSRYKTPLKNPHSPAGYESTPSVR